MFLNACQIGFVGADINHTVQNAEIACKVMAFEHFGGRFGRAGVETRTVSPNVESLVSEQRVFVQAVLVHRNDFVVRDIVETVLNQAVMELRRMAVVGPRPHLDRLI